jgi:hypothetical protein
VRIRGKSERHFIEGREEEHSLLKGSQASLSRTSDKSRVKVKALSWLNAVARQRLSFMNYCRRIVWKNNNLILYPALST